jgi:hypothetical protein
MSFHVFTPDGHLYVSDSADGDRQLASLVTQYPDAVVRTEDRNTGEVLAEEMPLLRLLSEERGYVMLGGSPSNPDDAKEAA